MNPKPHLQVLERIKKPPTEGPLASMLWRILGIIIFPIALILGAVVMAVMGLISLAQTATSAMGGGKRNYQESASSPDPFNEWLPAIEKDGVTLYRKNIGEIRYGPGYFWLKSSPEITALNGQTFGEWMFRVDSGILLQRWNSTTEPDTDLLMVDLKTMGVRTIAKNIPSVQWEMKNDPVKGFTLTCDTGQEILRFQLAL